MEPLRKKMYLERGLGQNPAAWKNSITEVVRIHITRTIEFFICFQKLRSRFQRKTKSRTKINGTF